MKSILTSTALATVLVFGLAAAPGVVRAQDANQQCTGENCPSKKMKAPEQNQQMNEQATPRKKKMGAQNGDQNAQGEEGTQYKKKKMGNAQQNGNEMNAQTEEGTQFKKKKRMGTQENGNVRTGTSEETVTRKKRRVGVQTENDVNVNVNTRSGRMWHFDPSHERRSRTRSVTFRFYYEGWYYPEPYWTHVGYGYGRFGISCGAGRAIVAQRFNRVRVLECRGPIYTYIGRREGDTFRVMVSARSGRIVGRDLI